MDFRIQGGKKIGSIKTTARETVHVLPSRLEIEAVVLKAKIKTCKSINKIQTFLGVLYDGEEIWFWRKTLPQIWFPVQHNNNLEEQSISQATRDEEKKKYDSQKLVNIL